MPFSPHYLAELAPYFRGKKIVLAPGGTLSDMGGWLDFLASVGAEPPFLLAPARGNQPKDGHVLETDAGDALDYFRHFGAALENLPASVQAALDAWDPEGRAIAVVNTQYGLAHVGGRPVFFSRPEAWTALEDKTRIDALWRLLEIPHPAHAIVSTAGDLTLAHRRLASPTGTVWSGDSREGFNGGACLVRHVPDDAAIAATQAFFATRCDALRVAPHLDGVPAAIHGFVLPDSVLVGRPVEQLVFRDTVRGGFAYGGIATVWDPPAETTERMRALAEKVGNHLRATVGYGGAFAVDGLLCADGFWPTEINPRYSAGFATQIAPLTDIPFAQLDLCARKGIPVDYRSHDLAGGLDHGSEIARTVVGWMFLPRVEQEPRSLSLRGGLGSADVARAAGGTLLRIGVDGTALSREMPVGALALELFREMGVEGLALPYTPRVPFPQHDRRENDERRYRVQGK